jgi:hypothetical protein
VFQSLRLEIRDSKFPIVFYVLLAICIKFVTNLQSETENFQFLHHNLCFEFFAVGRN